jgi:hypothetical protein
MGNLEKVKKGLEMCKIRLCDECPYDDENECSFYLNHDALELLEEQEERIKELELEKGWDESPDMMGKW